MFRAVLLVKRLCNIFFRKENGNTALIFALSLPMLLGVAGTAVDFATVVLKRAELQAASDGAAISAAKQMGVANSTNSVVTAAAANYLANQLTDGEATATNTVAIDRTKASVKVVLTENWHPFFAQFINADITPIMTSSTAVLQGNSKLCILALNPSENHTYRMMNSAQVSAPGCVIYSNSTDKKGMDLQNFSSVTAKVICSSGGVSANKAQTNVTPQTDCPLIPDPLASQAPPPVGSCSANNTVIAAGIVKLSPGVYCGGIKVASLAVVNFDPGVYVIKGGPLKLGGATVVTGKNVGFYLTGNGATLDFSGTAAIDFSGSETGPMAGLLVFADRSQADGTAHKISSSLVLNMTGTIYLPTGDLTIDPNASVAGKSAYTAIVAERIRVNNSSVLTLNSDYGATAVPVPQGIDSAAKVILTN
ncbi:MAG: TadE/TadG family type IV pilus assembly protein [Aestuariivirga sp.]